MRRRRSAHERREDQHARRRWRKNISDSRRSRVFEYGIQLSKFRSMMGYQHPSHENYFDCALHDTHWPGFFMNVCPSHAGRDSGGVPSTVSTLHIGGLPRAVAIAACCCRRVAFGDARGCTDGRSGHHASNSLSVRIKSNIFRPAPSSAPIQAKTTSATSTGDGSVSATPSRTIAKSSGRSRASCCRSARSTSALASSVVMPARSGHPVLLEAKSLDGPLAPG